MKKPENEVIKECLDKFIEYANTLKDEGIEPKLVSHAMMCASTVYITYALAGNDGYLADADQDKVVGVYKTELQRIQTIKKSNQESR